jgi:hypothetical protein
MTHIPYKYRASVLFELAIAMAILGVLISTLFPILKPLRSLSSTQDDAALIDKLIHSAEAYAIARGRLPCPANKDDGIESISQANECTLEHGFVPWTNLGVVPIRKGWKWHVAGLSSLTPPLAGVLTRPYSIRTIALEELSSAILNPLPNSGVPTSATAPAYQICDSADGIPTNGSLLCSSPPLLATAVLVVVPTQKQATAIDSYNTTSQRLFLLDRSKHLPLQVQWISYERLMWLWLQSGVLL